MVTEVRRGVLASAGISGIALFCVGLIMIYPPTLQHVGGSIFNLLKIWWLLVVVGGIYFIRKGRLDITYLAWSNLITFLALLYNLMVFDLIYSIYSIADWAYKLSLYAFFIFSLYQLVGRFAVGGYRECVNKKRVIPSTFYFYLDNHVDTDFSKGEITPLQEYISRVSMGIAGFGGALGAVIEGTSLLGGLFAVCISISFLAFSVVLFRFVFPDLIICLIAGFDKKNKSTGSE